MKLAVSFVAGLLFAAGLVVSGMTLPSKVIGFLDITGNWDASLALVMVGAIGVHFVFSQIAFRRGAPLLDTRFHLAEFTKVDGRLLGGAALFGVGWGLAGYCPGPGVVAAGAGGLQALTFVGGMALGMGAWSLASRSTDATSEVALERAG